MSDDRGPSGTTLVLAFVAGAVAGAVVALLATPKTGREMREAIGEWTRDGKAGEAASRAAKAARRAFDDIVAGGD
jgi:gas vesicle protein